MGWKSDAAAMDAVKDFLINQKGDLDKLIEQLFNHNDGSPPFQFLQLYGKFVFIFTEYAEIHTELEAWDLAVAEIMNDEIVQRLSAQMVGDRLDQRLKHE